MVSAAAVGLVWRHGGDVQRSWLEEGVVAGAWTLAALWRGISAVTRLFVTGKSPGRSERLPL
jgi:hypothetical protein